MESILSQLKDKAGVRNSTITIHASASEARQYNAAVMKMFKDKGDAYKAWKNNSVAFKLIKA